VPFHFRRKVRVEKDRRERGRGVGRENGMSRREREGGLNILKRESGTGKLRKIDIFKWREREREKKRERERERRKKEQER
jgi:hypothetical protein